MRYDGTESSENWSHYCDGAPTLLETLSATRGFWKAARLNWKSKFFINIFNPQFFVLMLWGSEQLVSAVSGGWELWGVKPDQIITAHFQAKTFIPTMKGKAEFVILQIVE